MRYGETILKNLEDGGEICGNCEHFGSDDYKQWNVCELDGHEIIFISKACENFEPGPIYRLREKIRKAKESLSSKQTNIFSETVREVLNDPELRESKDRRIKQLRGANKDRKRRTI